MMYLEVHIPSISILSTLHTLYSNTAAVGSVSTEFTFRENTAIVISLQISILYFDFLSLYSYIQSFLFVQSHQLLF